MSDKLNSWQTRNAKLTREFCNDLLGQLKQRHLDPVLSQLRGKEGAKLSFEDIIGGYNRIKEDYEDSAIGAKDVIAAVFFEFHPVSSAQRAYMISVEYIPHVPLNLKILVSSSGMLESTLNCLRFLLTIHPIQKLTSSSKIIRSCQRVVSLMKIKGENHLIQIVLKSL